MVTKGWRFSKQAKAKRRVGRRKTDSHLKKGKGKHVDKRCSKHDRKHANTVMS